MMHTNAIPTPMKGWFHMKGFTLILALLVALPATVGAHNAHKNDMNVTLNLSLGEGQDITISYRAINIGSGSSWTAFKAGDYAAFPIAKLKTSMALTAGEHTIEPGEINLVIRTDDMGKQHMHFGGSRGNPGSNSVLIETSAAPDQADHLIITATHGDGENEIVLIMVYGDMMGTVTLSTK